MRKILFLFCFATLSFLFASQAKALTLVEPHAFFIVFENVVAHDELIVEKKSPSSTTITLKGFDSDRVLNIYESTIYEETSIPKDYKKTDVLFSTLSEKITICAYVNSKQTCGNRVEGEMGGVSLTAKLNDEALRANDIFLDAYQNEIGPEELENILNENQLNEYLQYSSYILDRDKKKIEDFQIQAILNGKEFTVYGAIYYQPNYSTFSEAFEQEAIYKNEITVIRLVSIIFMVIIALSFFIPITYLLITRKSITKEKKRSMIIIIILSIFAYFIYWFIKSFFSLTFVY